MSDLEIKFYCASCGEFQPVEIEPLRRDNLNGDTAWGDIVCKECHFVIATVTTEVEGIIKFIPEDETVSKLKNKFGTNPDGKTR